MPALFLAVLLTLLGSAAMPTLASAPSADSLRRHVEALAGGKTPRSVDHPWALAEARDYIAARFREAGLADSLQTFRVGNREYANVIGRLNAGAPSLLVAGAHYDVCGDQPGADDNASGVAGLIEAARLLKPHEKRLGREIQFVAYANEEPPFFATEHMGSVIHARSLKAAGARLEVAVVLEMIGYYSDAEGSQRYPDPALEGRYPDRGKFIAAVSDPASRAWLPRVRKAMARASKVACEVLAAPPGLTGVDFSDHRSYWDEGFQALLLTDTAFFRNPHYHQATDTPATLDYARMGEVVRGLQAFLLDAAT